jgi:hypothetical protein
MIVGIDAMNAPQAALMKHASTPAQSAPPKAVVAAALGPIFTDFAEAVATVQPEAASASVEELAERLVWRSAYARFLNRLLFRLVVPRKRGQIFKRFYRVLREPSIERFYSHRFGAWDATRIVVGIPPTWIGLRPWRFVRSFFGGDV